MGIISSLLNIWFSFFRCEICTHNIACAIDHPTYPRTTTYDFEMLPAPK
uniref:Uncharacterized protein n=1 Tax=Marseillevirus sp. TaxID=2809551 RepID=A0AA96ERL3_9VIRU|nr:hypothetical protein MarFTMF_266 [Marseillevirus sp.]